MFHLLSPTAREQGSEPAIRQKSKSNRAVQGFAPWFLHLIIEVLLICQFLRYSSSTAELERLTLNFSGGYLSTSTITPPKSLVSLDL